jgi:ABC-type transporter Mla subunit MlaD
MNTTNHFKIGLFIVTGLALFVAGLFAFGARGYFEKKTIYETYVQGDVEGLSVGSPVKLRGVNVGKVTLIGFTWTVYPDGEKGSILVEFEIPQYLDPTRGAQDFASRLQGEIKKGLRARVKSMSVTGSSFVSLEYVSPEENPEPPLRWQPRYYYIPSAESQFSQMLTSIEKTLRNVEKVDFSKISQSLDGNLDLIGKIFKKVDQVDVHAIGTNVQELLVSARRTSDDLRVFIGEARGTVKNMHLESVGQNAETLLNKLAQSNDRLKSLLDSFDMNTANATLDGIRQMANQLQEVLADFKRYPSSYFLGEPPRPATAVKPNK